MFIDEHKLRELGFVEFIHLQKSKRDGVKRYVWMQIVGEEITTIRIKLFNNSWIIDHVNPNNNIVTFNDAIEFIRNKI